MIGAGLTGDAVGFGVEDDRLVAWKPAFGGRLVAAITCRSEVQMATVRPGVLSPLRPSRPVGSVMPLDTVVGTTRGRVRLVDAGRDDDVESLLAARTVVAVGSGVAPEEYGELDRLCKVLGAELGASRKVTDEGWLPRARQVGITGHSIAPALYVAIGVSGKFNHIVGARGAGTNVAINNDPAALILDWADVAIVGDQYRHVVPSPGRTPWGSALLGRGSVDEGTGRRSRCGLEVLRCVARPGRHRRRPCRAALRLALLDV